MNPFVLSGFAGGEYFCDRQKELKQLTEAFENGRNVTLFSLRRMGKSSLIKFLFEKLGRKASCIYADIFPAGNFRELAAITANAVVEYYGNSFKDYLKQIASLVKSINATVYFDEFSGKPKIKIGAGEALQDPKSFEEIIAFVESKKKRTLMVFDEFQQLRRFPVNNAEASLRSAFQKCRYVNFMFLGSNRGMMDSIFNDASSPFYQSTQSMQLEEINSLEYTNFIIRHFKNGKQKISTEQAQLILNLTRQHTYYVQQLCNRLYSKKFTGEDKMIIETLDELLKENEPVYNNLRNLMSPGQWKLVKAIAKEDKVTEPYADSFHKRHGLGPSASVRRALIAMLEKDIVAFYKNNYIINDVFFSLWLKRLAD